jgi:Domain of unknown function (DUF5655)/Domain of unknown function (DUF4287)
MPTVAEALRTQVRNIETHSGRSMAEWTRLIQERGLTKHGEIVSWLKSKHGMSHGNANRVALIARDPDAGAGRAAGGAPISDDAAAALYAGKKADLRPIHDRVMAIIGGFGPVEVAPKKGYVSLRRRKQFAMLQPATSHVDLGLILPGTPPMGRLEAGGSFNAMFSHRVRLASPEAVDAEVVDWLRTAFEGAG